MACLGAMSGVQKLQLSRGATHVCWDSPPEGADSGPLVLLVHGATVPSWQFERLVPELTKAGFRTLRMNLYGHGDSSKPRGPLPIEVLIEQVEEVLEAVSIDESLSALGHSLGAAVLAGAASNHPHRFDKIMLVAPMLDYMALNPATRMLRVPLLGELITHLYTVPMLVRRRRRRYGAIGCHDLAERFVRQTRIPGFGRALLSLFRSGALSDQSRQYRKLAGTPIVVRLVWGSGDTIVCAEHVERVKALLGDAIGCDVFADLEHNLLMSHPREVTPVLVRFLSPAGHSL
ncbi:MAG: alpha/beta fold hydrolase [Gammaproteobacteria bacterium]|nr:alpha/beta fold hydrolase [Gammaproteobacteria bacterium]